MRTRIAAAVCVLTALAADGAQDARVVIQTEYEGDVAVTADGNGILTARFPTTIAGNEVTHYLEIRTGCAQDCPPAVRAASVTLNGEVVVQEAAFAAVRRRVVLNLAATVDNEITVTVDGRHGAAASFAVVGVRRLATR